MTGRHFYDDQDMARRDEDRAAQSAVTGRTLLRTYNSQTLFAGATEIGIEHGEQIYRLKITRQGKLILNK